MLFRPGSLVEVPHLRIGARVIADSDETGLHVDPREAWRGEVEISRLVPVI